MRVAQGDSPFYHQGQWWPSASTSAAGGAEATSPGKLPANDYARRDTKMGPTWEAGGCSDV